MDAELHNEVGGAAGGALELGARVPDGLLVHEAHGPHDDGLEPAQLGGHPELPREGLEVGVEGRRPRAVPLEHRGRGLRQQYDVAGAAFALGRALGLMVAAAGSEDAGRGGLGPLHALAPRRLGGRLALPAPLAQGGEAAVGGGDCAGARAGANGGHAAQTGLPARAPRGSAAGAAAHGIGRGGRSARAGGEAPLGLGHGAGGLVPRRLLLQDLGLLAQTCKDLLGGAVTCVNLFNV